MTRRLLDLTGPGGPAQLSLDLDRAPRAVERVADAAPRPAGPTRRARPERPDPAPFLDRLRALGLRGIDRVRLTRNRTVMVSFSGGELRVHEGYVDAPELVLRAVVGFVCGRTRAERSRARESILAHLIARASAPRRRERTRVEDEPVVTELVRIHAHFNRVHFDGRLREVPIRLSSRMRTRLGHYTAASPTGEAAEIVVGRDHVRRHGWDEALHTLLHEMVHQWQDESGQAIDHGTSFRRKARDVGIIASARRHVVPRRARTSQPMLATPETHSIGLRAARAQ